MQAEAKRPGVFDKCRQSIETQIAEPNYQMHPSLMRADFDVRIRKATQCFDYGSPTIGYLFD